MYEIFGAEGIIDNKDKFLEKISFFSKKNNLKIQVFDADLIFGKKHIISSLNHALRVMKQNKNSTNSIEMEIMLYASGERQLKLAIPKMGIKNNTKKFAFLLISNNHIIEKNKIDDILDYLSIKRCDNVLNYNEKKIKEFGINSSELKTISKRNYERLILEKVALVDIKK